MINNFVCMENCTYYCDCCPCFGLCGNCERLDSDYCKNCYYFDEEDNINFYEERKNNDL